MQPTTISASEAKAFVLSAVALSASLFNIGFWYGVFDTIFFEHLFFIWVAATVALIASLFVPTVDALPGFVSWRGRIVLLIPSVWLTMEAMNGSWLVSSSNSHWYWLAAVATAVLSLPYVLYVLVLVAVPDVERLTQPRLKLALVTIAGATTLAGLSIGSNHATFLTCQDFKVAGDDVPANCRQQAAARFDKEN